VAFLSPRNIRQRNDRLYFSYGAHGDLARAAVRLGFEFHFLALRKTPQSGALQSGRVNEHVVAAAIGRDESEAF
jgi:hypothetical protein